MLEKVIMEKTRNTGENIWEQKKKRLHRRGKLRERRQMKRKRESERGKERKLGRESAHMRR